MPEAKLHFLEKTWVNHGLDTLSYGILPLWRNRCQPI